MIHTKVLPQASATIDSPNVSTACLNEPSLNNDMIEPKEIGNSAETKVSESSSKRFFKETLQLSGQAKPSSIITSATQILKEGEQQWLNSEVCFLFFSLKSYLYQVFEKKKLNIHLSSIIFFIFLELALYNFICQCSINYYFYVNIQRVIH